MQQPGRVAILGIGNELNGDDAAGPLVARGLLERQRNEPGRSSKDAVLVLETGPAPESFTGPLRRFAPELVLMVDAAELGEAPGTVRWLGWPEVEGGMSASTHTLPPTVLARFLTEDLGCQIALVGIQPATLDFDAGLSPEVERAVQQVTDDLWRRFFLNGPPDQAVSGV